jgi:hypothetical protein
MKTHKKTPSIATLAKLFASLKTDIRDDYRCSDDPDDETPGICVTIGWTPETGGWSYQTGDNSFTGGAYGHTVWAVVSLYRGSNSRLLARSAVAQLLEDVSY